jgi:uncharacterized protein (TIGR03382 family)
MKIITKTLLAVLLASASSATAATITLSAGLPAQGVVIQVGYTVGEGYSKTDSFFWQAGNWDGSAWTAFGTVQSKVGNGTSITSLELNGAVSATSPSTLEGKAVHILVGTSSTPLTSTGGGWVIFSRSAAGTNFPTPITGSTNVTFAASTQANLSVVASGNVGNGFIAQAPPQEGNPLATVASAGYNLIPEPSTAALGLLAGLGLLVRRRRD